MSNHELSNEVDIEKSKETSNVIHVEKLTTGENITIQQAGGDIVAGNKITIERYIVIQQEISKKEEDSKKIVAKPYKFLSSYDISDKDIFFGREALTDEIAREIPRNRVLLINGASGSGKSSLINAGLIPRLAIDGGYTYLSFREYRDDPIKQLQGYLVKTGIFPTANSQVDLLSQIVQAFQQQQLKVVFIFDQFERFFVNVPSAGIRAQFIGMIKICMDNLQPNEMNIIFSMRAEYLGKFSQEFGEIIPDFVRGSVRPPIINIPPLSRDEARDAIIKPVEKLKNNILYDYDFVDNVLLKDLTTQTGEVGIDPPHLQIVCNQLYDSAYKLFISEKRGSFIINAKLYEGLGKAKGILENYLDEHVKEIANNYLNKHLEGMAYSETLLDKKKENVQILLKMMVDTGTKTANIRKFVTTEQLEKSGVQPSEIEEFIQQLQDARIIEMRPQEQSYSLSHEFMVTKVASWLDEREVECKKAQKTLEHGLIEWKKWPDDLLTKKQVEKIRSFLTELTREEEELLQASEKAYLERERKEEEQKRQIALAQAARQKAIRRGLIVAVILALIATGFGVLSYFKEQEAQLKTEEAIKERDRADQQAQISLSRQLAAQAEVVMGENNSLLQQGTLLAIESMRLSQQLGLYSPQADKVIRQGLSLLPQRVAQITYSSKYSDVSFSRDGQRVAVAKNDAVQVLEIGTNRVLLTISYGGQEVMRGVKFGPDAQHVAIIETDRIKIYELREGVEIGSIPFTEVQEVIFSSTGKYLVISNGEQEQLWALDSQPIKRLNLQTNVKRESPQRFDMQRQEVMPPDFIAFRSSADDGVISLNDVPLKMPTLSRIPRIKVKDNETVVCVSSEYIVAINYETNKLKLINAYGLEQSIGVLDSFDSPRIGNIYCSGEYLVAEGLGLKMWTLPKGHEVFSLGQPEDGGGMIDSAITANGKYLAIMSTNKNVVFYDISSKSEVSRIVYEEDSYTSNEEVSFYLIGNDRLAVKKHDGGITIHIYELQSEASIFDKVVFGEERFYNDRVKFSRVKFSLDGRYIAVDPDESNDSHSSIRKVWEILTEKEVDPKTAIQWSTEPKKKFLITEIEEEDEVLLRESSNNKEVVRIKYQQTELPLFSTFLSLDGRYCGLLFGMSGDKGMASNGIIQVWDIARNNKIMQRNFPRVANTASFSPDGNFLAITDGVVKVFKLDDGQEVLRIEGVSEISFSPDGKYLVTSSDNRIQLRLWHPEDIIAQACQRLTRNLTPEEWQRFLPEKSYQKTCPQFSTSEP